MEWKLILWCISALWWVYVIWFIAKFNVPFSWSSTFYTLKEKYGRNAGYYLLGVEFMYSLPLIPIVVERSGLLALAVAAIVFTATAADYRSGDLPLSIHMAGSISSVTLAIILFGVLYKLWIFSIPFAILIALIYFKKIKFKNHIMWIETATMLAGHIIILINDVL